MGLSLEFHPQVIAWRAGHVLGAAMLMEEIVGHIQILSPYSIHVQVTAWRAGHVLGAAMLMEEIVGHTQILSPTASMCR